MYGSGSTIGKVILEQEMKQIQREPCLGLFVCIREVAGETPPIYALLHSDAICAGLLLIKGITVWTSVLYETPISVARLVRK